MTSASPSGRTPPPPACTWDAPPAATAATAGAGSAEAGTTTETDTGETRPVSQCQHPVSSGGPRVLTTDAGPPPPDPGTDTGLGPGATLPVSMITHLGSRQIFMPTKLIFAFYTTTKSTATNNLKRWSLTTKKKLI